jgi:hypothetical protein
MLFAVQIYFVENLFQLLRAIFDIKDKTKLFSLNFIGFVAMGIYQ